MSSHCNWTRTIRLNAYAKAMKERDRLSMEQKETNNEFYYALMPKDRFYYGDSAEWVIERSLKPCCKSWKNTTRSRKQYLRHNKCGVSRSDLIKARKLKGSRSFHETEKEYDALFSV